MNKPILFSGPMVRAILEGRKTQTRRTIRRLRRFGPVTVFGPSDTRGYDWHFRDKHMRWNDLRDAELRDYLPYAPGDLLWVRESWRSGYDSTWLDERLGRVQAPRDYDPKTTPIEYMADGTFELAGKNRPGIHMPRWASRLTLLVNEVRVERLQAITCDDAEAEGVINKGRMDGEPWAHCYMPGVTHGYEPDPTICFASLWESINGNGSWDANPWVCVISFSAHRMNIDAYLAQEKEIAHA